MDRRTLLKSTGLMIGGLTLNSLICKSAIASNNTGVTTSATLTPPSEKTPLLLNFNENSLGMSAQAKLAITEALPNTFRYPDAAREALQLRVAQIHHLNTKNVSLGNGSSEVIQATIQSAIRKAQKEGKEVQVIVPDPTFNYAELYAEAAGVKVVKVSLNDQLNFDFTALKHAVNSFTGASIVYLCNPNNPTATIASSDEIEAWIRAEPANTLFLLDEAYAEFVTDPGFRSAIDLVISGQKNLVVTRTFSKIYALAGLRVGYAIASSGLVSEINDFMSLDNTNLFGAVAALASLNDKPFITLSRSSIEISRNIVVQALQELELEYLPSQANFIFHKVPGDVKTYQERMKQQHVYVGREFPPAVGWNRLTLGTPEEMSEFVSVLKSFRAKGWV